jgi:serine/threonine protein kinase
LLQNGGMSAVRLPSPGEVVLGRLRVLAPRGNGAMGVLFEAFDEARGHKVALKVLRPEIADLPGVALRMSREGLAMSLVDDPHLVRIYDVGRTELGLPFLSMEWLDGADLGKILAGAGRVPVPTAVRWIRQACEGLAQAHARGIVHRDVKPENLFLAAGPNGEPVLKVIDFGVSKVDGAAVSLTQTHASIGTPLYMSPEQIRALRDVDARADVWALGVVLFELLAGHPPFDGESAESVIAAIVTDAPKNLATVVDVPAGLADVISRALAKDRSQRFATVQELAQALLPFESAELEPAPTLVTELPPDFDFSRELGSPPTPLIDRPTAEPAPLVEALGSARALPFAAAPSAVASEKAPVSQARAAPVPASTPSKRGVVFAAAGLLLAGAVVSILIVLGLERRSPRTVASSAREVSDKPLTIRSALADASAAPRNPTCILRDSTQELVGVRPLEPRWVVEDLDAVLDRSPNTTIRLASQSKGSPGEVLAWNTSPLVSEVHEGHATILIATDRDLYVALLDTPGVERLDDSGRERLFTLLDEQKPGVLVLAEGELPMPRLRETFERLKKLPRVGLLVPVLGPPRASDASYACAELPSTMRRAASASELEELALGLRAGEESCGRDHPYDAWLPVRVRMLPGSDAGQGCWERSSRATSAEMRVCAATVARRLSLVATKRDQLISFELVPRGPVVRALCE